MIRKISFLATTWNDYSTQGQEYSDLAEWWVENYHTLPGTWDPSYYSWTKWYNDKLNNQWSGSHKGPKESLEILKQEAGQKDYSWPLSNMFTSIETPVSKIKEFGRSLFNRHKEKKEKDRSSENILVKPGADIENVSPQVREFIDYLGEVYSEMEEEVETPVVTSGYRSPSSQARVMAKNWRRHGGKEGGESYFLKLYKDDIMAKNLHEIFENYGTDDEGISLAKDYIEEHVNLYPNSLTHVKYPSEAIDLRLTSGIGNLLNKVIEKGGFNIKVLKEDDHYHIKVVGRN